MERSGGEEMNKYIGKYSFAILGSLAIILSVVWMGPILTGEYDNSEGTESQYFLESSDNLKDFKNSEEILNGGYTDIDELTISSMNGDNLVITLRVNGTIPQSFSSQDEEHHYIFVLHSEEQIRKISFSISEQGYDVRFFEGETMKENKFQGSYEVIGPRLKIEIPLKTVGYETPDFEVASVGTLSSEGEILGVSDFLSNTGATVNY